jgi:uncharacterized protein (TIGR02147 family)
MSIFEHSDYRSFLNGWISSQPRAGRGMIRAWAQDFRVHGTLISQILSGKRSLSLELAEQIADKLGLTENESDYFFLLIQHNQAGTKRLKEKLFLRIQRLQKRAEQLGSRVGPAKQVSEAARAEFYSSWLYSGVRNLSAIERFQSVDAIANHLGLPKQVVTRVMEFLLSTGLCVKEDGQLKPGPKQTHVNAGSPLVTKHHQNWRIHGFSKMLLERDTDRFATLPMSLSFQDAEKLRQKIIPEWVSEVAKLVGPSKSETVRCLNIDFFSY